MDFDIMSALWFAMLVLLTMWASRTLAGVMTASDSQAANTVGRALGSIVG
jgi:hypothetical protein